VVTLRGAIWWADLGPVEGTRPAKRRPVLVVQSDRYNESRTATVIVTVVTSNTGLAAMPGNVFLPAAATGLPRDSVVNVTQLFTLNKTDLTDQVGVLIGDLLKEVEAGLRQVLQL
jgi:mRNA interferase MazF